MTTTHHQPTMRMSRRRFNALTKMAYRGMDEIEAEMEDGHDYTADDLAAAKEALTILRRMWGHLSDLKVDA